MFGLASKKNSIQNTGGVSEIIGTLAIVGLVIVLVAFASIMVFGIEVPLINPDIVYVDVSKTDSGGAEYIVVMHKCGESVRLMDESGCHIILIDPDLNLISLTNADVNPIIWNDGIPVYLYRTTAGYEISASRPAAPVAFDQGAWGVVGIDRKNDIVMFEDSVEF